MKTTTRIEDRLGQVPLFSSLPEDEIEHLAGSLNLSEYPEGRVIFQEDEPGDRFSIVLSGEIEIVKAMGTGDERILSVVHRGDFLGEMSLLFKDGLRSASGRTKTHVHLAEMTHSDFENLLVRHPGLAVFILREVIKRLRNSENATIRDLQEKNWQLTQAYQDLKDAQAQLIEKERLDQELKVARKIQESILPKEIPVIPGWVINAFWKPARAVGGDFYDFFVFPDNQLGIVVADVTDKGIPAAIVMATSRTLLRASAERLLAPGDVLKRVNDLLFPDIPSNMFVTCFYAVLNLLDGTFRYANAGHNPPYLCHGEQVVELRARGMPLGLMPGMSYEQKEAHIASGDRVLLFSDGLVEAHNAEREMYGEHRVQVELAEQKENGDLITYFLKELAKFTGPEAEQEDDVTLVTLDRALPLIPQAV